MRYIFIFQHIYLNRIARKKKKQFFPLYSISRIIYCNRKRWEKAQIQIIVRLLLFAVHRNVAQTLFQMWAMTNQSEEEYLLNVMRFIENHSLSSLVLLNDWSVFESVCLNYYHCKNFEKFNESFINSQNLWSNYKFNYPIWIVCSLERAKDKHFVCETFVSLKQSYKMVVFEPIYFWRSKRALIASRKWCLTQKKKTHGLHKWCSECFWHLRMEIMMFDSHKMSIKIVNSLPKPCNTHRHTIQSGTNDKKTHCILHLDSFNVHCTLRL